MDAAASRTIEDDCELVSRCLRGDRAASLSLYERHATFVLRSARSLGMTADESEDVAQEVFEVAYRKLGQFQTGQLRSWLYRIVANVVSDHHRRRRMRQVLAAILPTAALPEAPAPGPSPEGQLARRQARDGVGEILSRMSPKKREVFALYELEGLSGPEIAERVGCPVQTVWTRLYHARRDFAAIGRKRGLLDVE